MCHREVIQKLSAFLLRVHPANSYLRHAYAKLGLKIARSTAKRQHWQVSRDISIIIFHKEQVHQVTPLEARGGINALANILSTE